MTNFLLLARGESVKTARVVAVSADKAIVDSFLRVLAGEPDSEGPDDHAEREPLHVVPRGDDE